MSENKKLRDTFQDFLFPNYAPAPIIPERGMGSQIWDVEGNEFIDFSGGIAVSALGHCDLNVYKAMDWQSSKLWHVSNFFTTEPALKLAQKLAQLTFAERFFFCNSGAEANECALKMARRYCYEKHSEDKYEIVSAVNSFHGRTLFTVSVGGQEKYKQGFGPLPQGISHAPFNDSEAFAQKIGYNTCAVILEPIQGEGGVWEASGEFLKKIRELCDRHEALLIFDEVQSGNGRTGHLYAYQHYGVTPDILTTGKALGGGYPMGAVMALKKYADVMQPGTHGTTLGGNPLACAVALEMIERLSNAELLDHVPKKRDSLVGRIMEINEAFPVFEKATGIGLLIGLQLNSKFSGKAAEFMQIALKEKLLVLTAGPNTVRLAPALNITNSEMEEGLCYFEMAMKKFFASFPT